MYRAGEMAFPARPLDCGAARRVCSVVHWLRGNYLLPCHPPLSENRETPHACAPAGNRFGPAHPLHGARGIFPPAPHLCRTTLNSMADSDSDRTSPQDLAGQEHPIPFREAVTTYLEAKAGASRPRTADERRQIMQRILQAVPEWCGQAIAAWDTAMCRSALNTFPTPSARHKGYSHLNGLFRFALQQKWCSANPLKLLHPETKREPEPVLPTPAQLGRLLSMSESIGYRSCAPAVGLMLWAGIRSAEVRRMHWGDIDLNSGLAYLHQPHRDTGSPRQIPLQPVLRRWLARYYPKGEKAADTPLAPANWVRLWRDLRAEAGLQPWRPDTLRHTFAAYHLLRFRDIDRLRAEMGHSNPRQLRTRYLALRGITQEMCTAFWKGRFDQNGIMAPHQRRSR